MEATLGQVQRQTHGLLIFFVTIAAALLVGLAGGYGIRAWTSSSETVVAAPVHQAIPHVVPGYGVGAFNTGGFVAPLTRTHVPAEDLLGSGVPAKLPDRSDITNGSNNSKVINHRGDSSVGGRR
jgi:hypothetical protein